MPAAPEITLRHGAAMPAIGLGTWPMSSAEAEPAVEHALRSGYRMIDTAAGYGNEEGVGRGIRASGIPREEVFITTKLDSDAHGRREALEACAASARRLGVEEIDLLLIHWPLPWRDLYVETWRALIELLESGRVRAIGTSNFKPAHLERLREETGVEPDVNQIELNPLVPREEDRAYHDEHGIRTQSWSPLGLGVHRMVALGGPGAAEVRNLLEDPTVLEIAAAHRRAASQVVLRWHVELGIVPLPKSTDPRRIDSNVEIFDFSLTPAEVAAISAVDRGAHTVVDSDTFTP